MLAAHDDTALEALASKGIVRRARRDLEAGRARIVEETESTARVVADGQNVGIDDRGPRSARCDCPAHGICRHVVLAVMALRAGRENEAQTNEAQANEKSGAPVVAELARLADEDLVKFAGADWPEVAALASAAEDAQCSEEGSNCVVDLPDLGCSVTFIAGAGLGGAVCKGRRSRTRLAVALAALLARARAGVPLPEPAAAPRNQPRREFLELAGDTLVRAVQAVLPGRSAVAADLLLDLAISVRAEALPRLSGQLRALARQADQATRHDFSFEPDAFLRAAAQTFALIEALKQGSDDPALTGVVKRNYAPAEPMDIWVLAASRWRSTGSARGVGTYCYSASRRRWYVVSQGRAAGTDRSFDVRSCYRLALWSAASQPDLMGTALHLEKPSIADDTWLSPHSEAPAVPRSARITVAQLIESGAAADHWRALRDDLANRLGNGLRRGAFPIPAVIVPKKFGAFAFRELEQTYEWEAVDQRDDQLILSIPASDDETASQLFEHRARIRGLVTEVACRGDRLNVLPIAVLEGGSRLEVRNLDFDAWPEKKGAASLGRLRSVFSRPARPAMRHVDPLAAIAARVIDVGVAGLERRAYGDVAAVAQQCEAAGLLSLARSLDSLTDPQNVRAALAVTYLASEVLAIRRTI
jgi:hypothetical protein